MKVTLKLHVHISFVQYITHSPGFDFFYFKSHTYLVKEKFVK